MDSQIKNKAVYWGTGRRKTSVARVRLIPGNGQIKINGRPGCLLYTSPSPRDGLLSRMPSSA